ncbi:patatin-like phospholipase family protein [Pseudoxanthomonas mexicana]|uniref:patatin-like phospholipase family protein n=1 Tax=Pseudoxanthomonas mexicana TaxID=128785 RepID=UPI001FD684D8|nr:patatin-like phospholipase family protein [Pseudoxanthomonas mexicana]UOV05958.1 patatin-like phospholipase family protein [Pseudoxanthomonas mexicana]
MNTAAHGVAVGEKKVYVAFQGGGARGVAHIGALRALEASLIELDDALQQRTKPIICGLAGTSAGSIIAALVACGYKADNLLDRNHNDHLLKNVRSGHLTSLSHLFTKKGWFRIKTALLFIAISKFLFSISRRIYIFIGLLILASVSALGFAWFYWARDSSPLISKTIVDIGVVGIPIVSLVAAALLYLIWNQLKPGLAPLHEVRDVLNEAFRNGLRSAAPADKDLTFEDLERANALPLRIIATNLTTKRIQVFSAATTPDVSIADAVCASISLPYIFEPYVVEISGAKQKFADGGALSNLPLWTFDEERARDAECWTIGFSLEGKIDSTIDSHWAGAIVDAVVSGPPEIHARGIANLMMIPLRTSLNLLDFDKSLEDFGKEVSRIAAECRESLDDNIDAWRVNEFLRIASSNLLGELNSALTAAGLQGRFDLKIAIASKLNVDYRTTEFHGGHALYERAQRTFTGLAGRWPAVHLSSDKLRLSKEQKWWLPSSQWAIAIPFKKNAELNAGPVVIIESSDLTEADICAITKEQSVPNAFAILIEGTQDAWEAVGINAVLTERVKGKLINGNRREN